VAGQVAIFGLVDGEPARTNAFFMGQNRPS